MSAESRSSASLPAIRGTVPKAVGLAPWRVARSVLLDIRRRVHHCITGLPALSTGSGATALLWLHVVADHRERLIGFATTLRCLAVCRSDGRCGGPARLGGFAIRSGLRAVTWPALLPTVVGFFLRQRTFARPPFWHGFLSRACSKRLVFSRSFWELISWLNGP